jgi:hypothetical protein
MIRNNIDQKCLIYIVAYKKGKKTIFSYVYFFLNVFCVCGWPFYVFFFFYRLA